MKTLISKLIIRTINNIGRIFRSIGIRIGDANSETIVKKAMHNSGISTIIDDSFLKPLDVLVRSANQQPRFKLMGRFIFQANLVNRVSNRLLIDSTFANFPEILEQPINRPIFITGMPRTGTTLVHRLIAQDPKLRSTQYWEMQYPCPPPEKETYATDPRIKKSEQEVEMLNKLCPEFKSIHEFGACMPDECIFLFENDLMSDSLGLVYDLPEYSKWLIEQPMKPFYERHKKQLQLLQFKNPGERWILKSRNHLYSLNPLMQVYPDAFIIQIHRDPLETIASAISLSMASLLLLHDKVDPEKIGLEILEWIGLSIDQAMIERTKAESNPDSKVKFIDIYYKDLVTNPLGQIRLIYDFCDLEWSETVEQKMNTFLSENRQHKHGIHNYTLEQFKLTEGQILERFATYNKRFFKQ